jgi:hypothetical protein
MPTIAKRIDGRSRKARTPGCTRYDARAERRTDEQTNFSRFGMPQPPKELMAATAKRIRMVVLVCTAWAHTSMPNLQNVVQQVATFRSRGAEPYEAYRLSLVPDHELNNILEIGYNTKHQK